MSAFIKSTVNSTISTAEMAYGLISKIMSPPPQSITGMTDEQAGGGRADESSMFHDFLYLAKNGDLHNSAATIKQGLKSATGGPMNDRELLLEHGVSFLQSLPPGSATGKKAADVLIAMLWKDLPHPPMDYIGDEAGYRAADGSGNNPLVPDLGKAGSRYSKSVPSVAPKPSDLPDPGVIFDTLLRRPDGEFRPHPSGLSSMFFAFATVVIHECFQSNLDNPDINDTSSYVDLSTVYGNTFEDQKTIRLFDGSGEIYPDTIACPRIMLMPAATIAVLILFSRNHNKIVKKLLEIDERERYNKDLASLTEEQRKWQDEDLFQKARNINVGWFATIVLKDYVAAILNTVRADSEWSLDLGAEIRDKKTGERLARGGGNAVSAEFEVLYHWHASVSEQDAMWTDHAFKHLCGVNSTDLITVEQFHGLATNNVKKYSALDPREWPVREWKRQKDGRFKDEDIAKTIKEATRNIAGAFGANGVPASFKVIEVMAMMKARRWGICTMNEFREFLHLTKFESFLEWNSDPVVAEAAEKIYGHIDRLELYPGLFAEEAKPNMPGSGVCPPHTVGRGILDDAVSLIRSDRFLTSDFTSTVLTSWGIKSIKPCPGARGGLFPSLLFQHLPWEFQFNSSFGLLPFYTDKVAKEIFTELGVADQYTYSDARVGAVKAIKSFDGCKKAFLDRDSFSVKYNDWIKQMGGFGFLIGYDDAPSHDRLFTPVAKAMFPKDYASTISKFYSDRFEAALKKSALNVRSQEYSEIDICRDVCNILPIEWIAHQFGMPIKTKENPHGLFTIYELRNMLLACFVFSSFNVMPENGWKLRDAALKFSKILSGIIELHIKTASRSSGGLLSSLLGKTPMHQSDECRRFYTDLVKNAGSDISVKELGTQVLGALIPIAGNLTQQTTLLVDLFLKEEHQEAKNEVIRHAQSPSLEGDKILHKYILEGMRISPIVGGLPRVVAKNMTYMDGDNKMVLQKGDTVIIGIQQAHLDEKKFNSPLQLDRERPNSDYILLGAGLHKCLGKPLFEVATLTMIKKIFALPNLRRAEGYAGKLHPITAKDIDGVHMHTFLDTNSEETPAPQTLRVRFDTLSQ